MVRQRPTKRSWSDAAQRGNAIMCCSVSSVWPRCEPGKATTPPPTACTRRRSHAASTRRCLPTRWSAKRRLLVGSATWRGRGHCSTRRQLTTGTSDLPAGQTAVLAGLAWWALSAGQADDAMVFAADACQAAVRQRGPGNTTARRYRRSRSQGARRPDPPQRRGLRRARSAARPEFVVRQSHQFHRRAGCRRARGPPRASESLSGDSAATAAAGRFDTFLRPWAPPSANRKSQLQISSRRLTSVSPQRRLRPARQTGIHAASTRSARQPA